MATTQQEKEHLKELQKALDTLKVLKQQEEKSKVEDKEGVNAVIEQQTSKIQRIASSIKKAENDKMLRELLIADNSSRNKTIITKEEHDKLEAQKEELKEKINAHSSFPIDYFSGKKKEKESLEKVELKISSSIQVTTTAENAKEFSLAKMALYFQSSHKTTFNTAVQDAKEDGGVEEEQEKTIKDYFLKSHILKSLIKDLDDKITEQTEQENKEAIEIMEKKTAKEAEAIKVKLKEIQKKIAEFQQEKDKLELKEKQNNEELEKELIKEFPCNVKTIDGAHPVQTIENLMDSFQEYCIYNGKSFTDYDPDSLEAVKEAIIDIETDNNRRNHILPVKAEEFQVNEYSFLNNFINLTRIKNLTSGRRPGHEDEKIKKATTEAISKIVKDETINEDIIVRKSDNHIVILDSTLAPLLEESRTDFATLKEEARIQVNESNQKINVEKIYEDRSDMLKNIPTLKMELEVTPENKAIYRFNNWNNDKKIEIPLGNYQPKKTLIFTVNSDRGVYIDIRPKPRDAEDVKDTKHKLDLLLDKNGIKYDDPEQILKLDRIKKDIEARTVKIPSASPSSPDLDSETTRDETSQIF